jgi:hypothetical protein
MIRFECQSFADAKIFFMDYGSALQAAPTRAQLWDMIPPNRLLKPSLAEFFGYTSYFGTRIEPCPCNEQNFSSQFNGSDLGEAYEIPKPD